MSYTTATATGTITAGGTDIGNHCDDCLTPIDLPFPVNVYGAPVSVAFPASNGDIHFAETGKMFAYAQCIPVDPTPPDGPFLNTLFPFYDDLRTDETSICPDCGIFTQTLGTAPHRQFVIRWKTTFFTPPAGGNSAEFEVILTEGSDTLSVIYGDTSGDNGLTAASGIQQDLTHFTSFSCFEETLTSGVRVDYTTHRLWQSHADPDGDGRQRQLQLRLRQLRPHGRGKHPRQDRVPHRRRDLNTDDVIRCPGGARAVRTPGAYHFVSLGSGVV